MSEKNVLMIRNIIAGESVDRKRKVTHTFSVDPDNLKALKDFCAKHPGKGITTSYILDLLLADWVDSLKIVEQTDKKPHTKNK